MTLKEIRRAIVALSFLLSFFGASCLAESRGSTIPGLDLMIDVMGKTLIRLSPSEYDASLTREFYALEPAQQYEFLRIRRHNLEKILKRLRSQIVPTVPEGLSEAGWLAKKVLAPIQSVDYLLFQNVALLTAPMADRGRIYTAQVASYWGLGGHAVGLVFELTLLRERLMDGRMRTTISFDRPKVLRTYLPVPILSGNLRYIEFRSIQSGSDSLADVKVDHMPLGPVVSRGNNHLGLGFLFGFSLPPFPFGTFSGFVVQREKTKVLYACESDLMTEDTSEIPLD